MDRTFFSLLLLLLALMATTFFVMRESHLRLEVATEDSGTGTESNQQTKE